MKYYYVEAKTSQGVFKHWVKNFSLPEFIKEQYPYAAEPIEIKATEISQREYYQATK